MEKREKIRIIKKLIIYAVILTAILLLATILLNSTFSNYHSWRGHESYFKDNPSQKIEEWMTPNTILRHFNISEENLFIILNTSETKSNFKTPLTEICEKNNLDCFLVTDKLNKMVK